MTIGDQLHIAIIGSGYIGDCHISAYKAMDAGFARVTAVVDLNPTAGQKAAQEAGCSWFATLEEAVAQVPVDVVDICVPTFLHETFALKAAALGKHVFCEKPVTLTLESFDRMDQACRSARVNFMTGQVVRFTPEFVKLRELVESGTLGNLHMLSEKRLAQHPAWTTWHRDPEKSGGGLFDLNTHDIDFIYSLFGLPRWVSAVGWKSKTGCWNHVVTTLQWETFQAVCETSLEMTGDFPFTLGVRIAGDGGTADYRSTAGINIKETPAVKSFLLYPAGAPLEVVEVSQWDPFQKELEAFLESVVEGSEIPIPPLQTREVLRILLATKESLETQKIIYL